MSYLTSDSVTGPSSSSMDVTRRCFLAQSLSVPLWKRNAVPLCGPPIGQHSHSFCWGISTMTRCGTMTWNGSTTTIE